MEEYVVQTCRLLRGLREEFPEFQPDTVYLGGGTPSILGEKRLLRILETALSVLDVPSGGEITLEANPGTVNPPMLRSLRQGGFNRISFGVQSAVPAELSFLGRKHSVRDSLQAVQWASQAGFEHISLDFMMGLANQTEETLLHSLDFCISTPADHLSAYLLKIEPNTVFARRNVQNICPDDDRQADLYLAAVEGLRERGFQQYEISNFARNGQYAVHNLKYWNGDEYLGLGPGAHSFWNGFRYSIPRDLNRWLSAPNLRGIWTDEGGGGSLEEYLMLRFRLTEGVQAESLESRYPASAPYWEKLCRKALPFQKAGLLKVSPNPGKGFIAFTPQGFLVSNQLIGELLSVLE